MELVAEGLRKVVAGRELYSGLDLRLPAGATLVVRGPSGAGKTQLLRHLSGLDPERGPEVEQAGRVTLDGRDPSAWGACAWRVAVSQVPQVVPSLSGTPAQAAARLACLRAQRDREVDDPRALARDLGLAAQLWEQPWSELSVGEAQRALLAIFVARRPGVLLLDEPTAALDPQATRAVEERLRGRSCIWVTHSVEQAERVADDCLELTGSIREAVDAG